MDRGPVGTVMAVPDGGGAAAVEDPGVLAHPAAARLTSNIPCTMSAVLMHVSYR